jgi:hypothetical protein
MSARLTYRVTKHDGGSGTTGLYINTFILNVTAKYSLIATGALPLIYCHEWGYCTTGTAASYTRAILTRQLFTI